VLSITNANNELALQEQGETVKRLELAVEAVRRDLEAEKSKSKVSCCLTFAWLVFVWEFALPFLISLLSW
jgi:hypothetical protein